MERDELDRWLSEDEAIVPSSGFTGGVMDAVRREASAPPPIPFPWTRALPGIAAWAVAIVSTLALSVQSTTNVTAGPVGAFAKAIIDISISPATPWLALAVVLTVVPVMWSLRLMRG